MNFLPYIFALIARDPTFAKTLQDALDRILPKTPVAPLTLTWAQEQLKANGFDPGPIDGKLGSLTMAATRAYQAARTGLTVDGWLGPATLAQLLKDKAP